MRIFRFNRQWIFASKKGNYYPEKPVLNENRCAKPNKIPSPAIHQLSCLNQADFQKRYFLYRSHAGSSNKRFRLWFASLTQSNLIRYVLFGCSLIMLMIRQYEKCRCRQFHHLRPLAGHLPETYRDSHYL